jgi:hypothetical protein
MLAVRELDRLSSLSDNCPPGVSFHVTMHSLPQCGGLEWLVDRWIGNGAQERRRALREGASGHENHLLRLIGSQAQKLGMQIHSGHFRHHEIRQDDIKPLPIVDEPNSFDGRRHDGHVVILTQQPLNDRAEHGFVVDGEHTTAAPDGALRTRLAGLRDGPVRFGRSAKPSAISPQRRRCSCRARLNVRSTSRPSRRGLAVTQKLNVMANEMIEQAVNR